MDHQDGHGHDHHGHGHDHHGHDHGHSHGHDENCEHDHHGHDHGHSHGHGHDESCEHDHHGHDHSETHEHSSHSGITQHDHHQSYTPVMSHQDMIFTTTSTGGSVHNRFLHENSNQNHQDYYSADKEKRLSTQSSWAPFVRSMFSDTETRRISSFAILMMLVSIFELSIASISTSSITLLSAGLYSLFDGFAIGIHVISMLVAKRKFTTSYSYGFDRFEILAVFSNATLMIFVGLYIGFECLERIFEPDPFEGSAVLFVSLISIVVHVCGVLFFHDQLYMRSESVVHPSRNDVFQSYIHIVMDSLPAFNCLVVSLLVSGGEDAPSSWLWVDILLGLLNAFLIMNKSYPVAISTCRILLQSIPHSVKPIIEQNLRDASTVEGVLEIYQTNFWTYSPGVFVGSLNIRVRSDANEQNVLRQVQAIYAPYIKHLTIQIEKWND
eukprot:TRINITY_DN665_c0_g2_i1.p1 TRINITY_DN665_c0_g2~~TRINITY_DN665_c0_g2_i1.p1  ORF type:complete len:439 (-),score=57.58 TRINITY_DN665_c0_g2_i1:143-1459(-)